MKKVISIILSLVMLFSLLPMQAFAAEQYTDTAGNWAEGAIDRWSEYGVIEGSNGKFDPSGTLTRAQMAAILSRLLALPEAKSAGFSDVAQADWFAPYIDRCYAAGIMQGSNGKAQPNDPITREQAIVMLGRALGIKPIENADLSGYTDAATVSDWAKGYVAAMAQAGIVKGTSDTTVSPMASIDRAATVTILDRAIGTYANVDGAEVTAASSGIILIAADNVKVTGAAKGATVIVSPSADGVTVNGAAVAAGTTTAAAEEKPNKPVVSGGGGGGPTPSYSDLTINEAKTVTGGTYDDVIITAAVGNGDVTLNNVKINGKLIVQGGGSNSIHLNDCTVDTIEVSKDMTAQDAQTPRIALNNTPVETIEAVKPVIIEADQTSAIEQVEATSNVTVQGAATKIEKIDVPESAAESTVIDVKAGAVGTVEANKPTEVKGSGTVANVEANAAVTVASETVTTITVTVAVTVTVTGSEPVEVAVETTQDVSVVAASAQVEVSTTQTSTVSVQVNEQPVEHVHTFGAWITEIPAGTDTGTKGHYTCNGCNKNFDADHQELTDLVIPAKSSVVSTEAQLKTVMESQTLQGAILSGNLTLLDTVKIPAGKTLTIPAGKKLTVADTIYVYGTLDNKGTLNNLNLIDVFGSGTLTNSGTITGSNMDKDGVYGTSLGIEGGAVLTNTGTINDCISVADYYKAGGNQCCTINGSFDIASDSFDKIAVAFGAEQIPGCLALEGYEIVMACGTANGANTIDLGGITVPTGKVLFLKASVEDGTNTYLNSYEISAGKTLTLQEKAVLVTKGEVSIAVNGTIDNQGGFILANGQPFGSGIFVGSKAALSAALANGGNIYLMPFFEAQVDGEDRILILDSAVTVSKNTTLSNLGGDYLYIPGLTVASDKTLTLDGVVAVLAADSTISGTVELCNGSVLVVRTPDEATQDETTELTVAEGGMLVIGEYCGVNANSDRWSIINYGTIENYGGLATEYFTNNGTVIVNANSYEQAVEISRTQGMLVDLYIENDKMPDDKELKLTVRDLVVSEYFYVGGSLTVTGTLTVEEDAALEVSSLGTLTCTGYVSNQGTIIQTHSYQNSLETPFNQSTLTGVTANDTLKSLVMWEQVMISGNPEVDFLVIVNGGSLSFESGATLTVKRYIADENGDPITGEIGGVTIAGGENGEKILSAAQ